MRMKFFVLWLVAVLAAAVLILAPTGHVAQASASGVVISAAYGGGGNSGAIYTHDYVEIFNAGISSVSVSGWSIQIASAAGTSWTRTNLPAVSLAPGQYLIARQAAGAGGTEPTPSDVDGTATMSGAGANKIALLSTTTLITGGNPYTDVAVSASIVDFLGGGTANVFEGAVRSGTLSNSQAWFRLNDGCQDTDNNSADFAAGSAYPNARSTASPLNPCFIADLVTAITESADPIETNNGVNNSDVDYTVSVTNSGTLAANNVVFTTTLGGAPFDGTISALSDPGGFCSFASPVLTCSLPSLAASAGYTAGFTVAPQVGVQGLISIDTNATADAPETTGNNTDSDTTTVQDPQADVTVAIGYAPNPVYSHNTLSLTFDVANGPQLSAANTMLQVLLSGTALGSLDSSPTAGCTVTSPTQLDCALGTLPAGGSTQVQAVVSLSGTAGNVQVDAAVAADAPEATGNNNDSENITVLAGCGLPAANIFDYQEGGFNAGVRNVVVTFEGIVTADFQPASPNGMGGYHLQQVPGDGNTSTSDAIYVFNSSFAVSAGDKVRVTGTIVEFDQNGAVSGTLTQLTSVTSTIPCSTGHSVSPVTVQLPIASLVEWENYEGMLVELTGSSGPLVLTEMFALGQFGEVVVASERLFQPTNIVEPGAPAIAQQALNDRRKLLISDGRNGTPPAGTVPHVPNAAAMFRMGDTTPSVIGVINYTEFSGVAMHRLEYTVAPTWTNANVRPASAPLAGSGRLRVASFNVLNFFNGDGLGGDFPTSRGADTPSEYNRQRDKLVVALGGLDADIIGLMEIENDSGPNSAVAQLTAALNTYLGLPGEYAYINTGVVGGDEIRVAILYRTSAVSPSGAFAILDDVAPFNVNTRPPVLQTFTETLTGKDISVVVNHFKSKGSCPGSGPETDQGDGQSCWNPTRVLAAQELLAWLPTATPDTDILIIGDLNAYANEDPIDTIIAGGYTNLISAYNGASAYGYVFGGQSGYLDHALASASLLSQVTGANDWHINADEATLRDYNDFANQALYYEVNQFRTSDHDPVIIGINLSGADGVITSTPTVAAGQSVTVTVSDADLQGAAITVDVTSTEGEAETLTLDATANPGEYTGSFTIVNSTPTAGNLALEGQSGTLTFTYGDALTAGGLLNVSRTDTTTIAIPGVTGTIISTPTIFAGQNVTVTVNDLDLSALTITVGVVGSNGDSETLVLDPTANPGEYTGTFLVANDNTPGVGNGTIEEFGGTLTFTYTDALDALANVNSPRTDETTVSPIGSTATITSTDSIPSGAQVTVTVVDADIVGPSITVLATATGESASLQLDETVNPGEYVGTFTVLNTPPTPSNGQLELESGVLTFTYVDHLDSEGDLDSNRTDTTTVIASGDTGVVQATESIVPGADSFVISVSDSDLDATTVSVTVTSSAGELEVVALDMTAAGEYSRTFDTLDQNPTASSGVVEARNGDTLTVTYVDALDLEGDIDTSLTDTTTVIATNAPGSFTLTSPADGDILRDGSPMLEWTQAAGDNTYQVLLVQLSGNTRLGILIEAVVEADDVCAAGVCSIDPTTYVPDLAVGTYSWTVEATGIAIVEASNAPSVFTVVLDGIELVSNGGFENALTGWTKVAPAKVKCGAFGAGSDCALQLKPGGSVKQKDVMATVLAHVDSDAGDVLRVSALIWSPRSNLTRAVIVKVVYATPTSGANANGRDKIKLSPSGVTSVFAEYVVQFELDDAIVSGSVKLSNSALSGKVVVDDVSVQLMPIGTIPRADEPSGALPLPSAPGSFRGGN